MTREGSHLVGTICFLVPPEEVNSAGWEPGPLPLPWAEGVMTDGAVRSTYLAMRAGSVLYDPSSRFHCRDVNEALPVEGDCAARIIALERLHHPVDGTPTAAIGIVHLEVEGLEPTTAVDTLVRPPPGVDTLSPLATLLLQRGWFGRALERGRRVGSALLLTPPGPLSCRSTSGWSDLQHALWSAAALVPTSQLPPDEDDPSLLAGTVHLSGAWRGLCLRDGAGFVVHDDLDGEFAKVAAPVLVRTVYTDCVVLSSLQRVELSAIADDLAAASDRTSNSEQLDRIEQRATVMRNRLWWDDVSSHGPGNRILRACQEQQSTHRLFDRVMDDLEVFRAVVDSAALKEASAIQQVAERREAAFERVAKRAGVAFAAVSFSLTALAVSITGWTDDGVTMAAAVGFVLGAVAAAFCTYEGISWLMRRR